MNKSITRVWLVINITLFVGLIYMVINTGFENKNTNRLTIICTASNLIYLMYKMGIFKKGALRPDAETKK